MDEYEVRYFLCTCNTFSSCLEIPLSLPFVAIQRVGGLPPLGVAWFKIVYPRSIRDTLSRFAYKCNGYFVTEKWILELKRGF